MKGQTENRVHFMSRLLLLNAADGLDLRGLAVGAKLPEVFVLPTVTITLHDILVATITGVLVADKSVEEEGLGQEEVSPRCGCVRIQAEHKYSGWEKKNWTGK